MDWLINWSIDRLIDWLTDWLTDRSIDWSIDWLICSNILNFYACTPLMSTMPATISGESNELTTRHPTTSHHKLSLDLEMLTLTRLYQRRTDKQIVNLCVYTGDCWFASVRRTTQRWRHSRNTELRCVTYDAQTSTRLDPQCRRIYATARAQVGQTFYTSGLLFRCNMIL